MRLELEHEICWVGSLQSCYRPQFLSSTKRIDRLFAGKREELEQHKHRQESYQKVFSREELDVVFHIRQCCGEEGLLLLMASDQ